MAATADLALALDPVLLARRAGIEPDPWQTQVLRSASSRILLNCCRQAGKSTVVAVLAVHTALYEPGALALLLSPSLRQSQELFRKALAVYRALDGQMTQLYPESQGKDVRIQLDCESAPDPETTAFLKQVEDYLKEDGILILHHILTTVLLIQLTLWMTPLTSDVLCR